RYAYGEAVPGWQREQLEALTPPVIAFFSERFGDYPFAVAGGMVVDASLWFALETQTIPVHGVQIEVPAIGFTRDQMLEPLEETIVHELAHQWFGNAVSPLRWSDVYLNEGLTQYATYLWIEQRDGPAALESRLREVHGRMTTTARFSDPAYVARATGADFLAAQGELGPILADQIREALGAGSVAVVEQMPAEQVLDALPLLGLDRDAFIGPPPAPTGDPGPGDNFSALWVYERGSLATHALRVAIGDEAFFRVLRGWVERYGGGSATVQDFILLAEQESGQDLDPLFDAWLFQTVVPPFPGAADAAPATPAG
ncbi:MAG: M1 family aminopeptidase, partial [Chloroflexota bacterium]